MTLSTIISIAINLIFIYLVLSIVTSEIQEIIANILNLRSKNLHQSIIRLLGEHQNEPNLLVSIFNDVIGKEKESNSFPITSKIYEQYLTPYLATDTGQTTKSTAISNIQSKKFAHGFIAIVKELLEHEHDILDSKITQDIEIAKAITDSELQERLNLASDNIDNLPIGWNLSALFKEQFRLINFPNIFKATLGWVISAIAVSMGAPFWFTVLRNFMEFRSSQSQPNNQSNQIKSNQPCKNMNSTNPQPKNYLAVLLGTILLLISISVSWLFFTSTSPRTNVFPEVYYNALKDVEQVSSDEISTSLTAIVKDNYNIQWQGDRLKVATYAKPKYFELGSKYPASREVWVTVVPELKNFCTDYAKTGQEISPRLEQLLGLAPSYQPAKSIVELWVEAKDLFRPTPDPEITDHEAELEFRPANEFLTVSAEYQNWFNSRLNEFESQFRQMNPDRPPVPWTRLGYTYDWGDASDHIGLSEFVLRKGANLEVDSVSTVDEYCRGNSSIAMIESEK